LVQSIHHNRIAARNRPLVAIPAEARAISAMAAPGTANPILRASIPVSASGWSRAMQWQGCHNQNLQIAATRLGGNERLSFVVSRLFN
jgi:hypothetical protein